tara:strand:+ start:126 stop:767 length:642 start_codon:yes stop_codon:yes gene_type:complete
MAYKMKGPSLIKDKKNGSKVDPDAPGTPGKPGFEPPVTSMDYLTKMPVGPRATKKPFDREKFEEETRVAQGMENVEQELFSGKTTHDIVKKNIKNKTKNMKKESSFKLRSGNKPSFAKLSGVDKSPMRKNGEEKTYGKDKLPAEDLRDEAQDEIETNLSTARSRGNKDAERYNRIIAKALRGGKITKEEDEFLIDFQKKKKLKKKAETEAGKK